MMQLPLTGGCLCGTLRYEIAEAPFLTYTCHCTDCQRLTGSAFSIAIMVHERAFRLTAGEPRLLRKTADSGRIVIRWLCPDCAAWVCSAPVPALASADAVRRVRAGSLDDARWLQPTAHFWTRSRQSWVVLPDGETFDTQPADLAAASSR